MKIDFEKEAEVIQKGPVAALEYYKDICKEKGWKVAWLIPSANCRLNTQLFMAYLQMSKPPHVLVIKNHKPAYVNRNKMVEEVLEHLAEKHGITHLFWTDDDMYPLPPHTLVRLLMREKQIVFAPATTKEVCPRWLVADFDKPETEDEVQTSWLEVAEDMGKNPFGFKPEYRDKLVKVATGTHACILVDIDVYRKVKFPWYYPHYNVTNREHYESDIVFFHRARRQANADAWCDFTVPCLHMEKHVAYPHLGLYLRGLKGPQEYNWAELKKWQQEGDEECSMKKDTTSSQKTQTTKITP